MSRFHPLHHLPCFSSGRAGPHGINTDARFLTCLSSRSGDGVRHGHKSSIDAIRSITGPPTNCYRVPHRPYRQAYAPLAPQPE
jgi:hypothetical protein